jgi:putative oxidoreductase
MTSQTQALPTTAPARLPALAIPRLAPVALALLRVGFGLLFMQHGAQKLFGLLGGVDGSGATVALLSQYGIAGVLECFGGALVVLGLLTRPVAAVLGLLMVAAYFIAHAPQGGLPVQNGGELALLYAFGFLFLAAAGAGRWSLDGWLRRRALT